MGDQAGTPGNAADPPRLGDRGLIVRQSVDGRSHGLRLSETGRQVARRAQKIMHELENKLLERIARARRSSFVSVLMTLSMGET